MSRKLIVRGTVYNYPDPGEDSGTWGDESSDWAEAVTETLNLIVDENDILPTSFVIDNNVQTDQIIRALYFNPTKVRSANVSYSIYRSTDEETLVESGELLLNYNENGDSGEKWTVTRRSSENSNVILTFYDSGQCYYQSSDLEGLNYQGIIKFYARTLTQ